MTDSPLRRSDLPQQTVWELRTMKERTEQKTQRTNDSYHFFHFLYCSTRLTASGLGSESFVVRVIDVVDAGQNATGIVSPP
ncbi:MAG: hypothetical protein IPH85_12540 [Ignavibacteria bacterium]|nr:hypothetical protein [Ignavibacteria bacterium]